MCCCGHWEGRENGERCTGEQWERWWGPNCSAPLVTATEWDLQAAVMESWNDSSLRALEETLLDSEELDFYAPSQLSSSVALSRNIFLLIISCLFHWLLCFSSSLLSFCQASSMGQALEIQQWARRQRQHRSILSLPCSISTGVCSRFSGQGALNRVWVRKNDKAVWLG